METMFPGKVNSPATTLDGAIDNTVTTIDVIDGSVLPTAPNIAVIGTGEDAETILYVGKTANQLTTVTRGYQGTAKAWDSGATIARMFTEKDYASLKANIEEIAARKLSAFAATTSAELATTISDEVGEGKAVFGVDKILGAMREQTFIHEDGAGGVSFSEMVWIPRYVTAGFTTQTDLNGTQMGGFWVDKYQCSEPDATMASRGHNFG